MGIIMLFGGLFLLYLADKILMLIALLFLAIYIIVKKARKKKLGKIIILPIVFLIILQILSLPADLLSIGATIEAANYRKELKGKNCAYSQNIYDETFTYNGNEYVNLSPHLTDIVGDGRYIVYMDRSDNFKEHTFIAFKDSFKGFFKLFFFNADERTIYKLAGAEDDKILYSDFHEKIWCCKEDLEAYKQTYNDKSNYDFYIIYEVDGVQKQQAIKQEVFDEIIKCEEKSKNGESEYFSILKGESKSVKINAISKDGRVLHESICEDLIVINGRLYYLYSTYYEDGSGRDLNVIIK